MCNSVKKIMAAQQSQALQKGPLSIGDKLPEFCKKTVVSADQEPRITELTIPMLADTSKSLSEEMGILDDSEKVAYRATFIVDPGGIIRWVSVYPMNVGRNVEEVLRVLDALQTEELTACGWTPGEKTLTVTLKEEETL